VSRNDYLVKYLLEYPLPYIIKIHNITKSLPLPYPKCVIYNNVNGPNGAVASHSRIRGALPKSLTIKRLAPRREPWTMLVAATSGLCVCPSVRMYIDC